MDDLLNPPHSFCKLIATKTALSTLVISLCFAAAFPAQAQLAARAQHRQATHSVTHSEIPANHYRDPAPLRSSAQSSGQLATERPNYRVSRSSDYTPPHSSQPELARPIQRHSVEVMPVSNLGVATANQVQTASVAEPASIAEPVTQQAHSLRPVTPSASVEFRPTSVPADLQISPATAPQSSTRLQSSARSEANLRNWSQDQSALSGQLESNPQRSSARHTPEGFYQTLGPESENSSFLDREKANGGGDADKNFQLISRLGLNLAIVLGIALAAILTIKLFMKSNGARTTRDAALNGLKVDQVLQVAKGASLYLVDGAQNKMLVAVDGGGIKSVNVLPSHYDEDHEKDETELFGEEDPRESSQQDFHSALNQEQNRHQQYNDLRQLQQQQERTSPNRATAAAPLTREQTPRAKRRAQQVNQQSDSQIDENLIRMLLSKSRQTA